VVLITGFLLAPGGSSDRALSAGMAVTSSFSLDWNCRRRGLAGGECSNLPAGSDIESNLAKIGKTMFDFSGTLGLASAILLCGPTFA
jgi:hypothetical protein